MKTHGGPPKNRLKIGWNYGEILKTTPKKLNMEPKNWWFVDVSPFCKVVFLELMLSKPFCDVDMGDIHGLFSSVVAAMNYSTLFPESFNWCKVGPYDR